MVDIEDSDIFFNEIREINLICSSRLRALEDQAFAQLEEILENARKAFREDDICLLPKTPSAKRRCRKKKSDKGASPRRKIQLETSDTEIENEKPKGAKKRMKSESVLSDSDDEGSQIPSHKVYLVQDSDEENKPPVRQTRAMRANSRAAATTSRATNTRNAKKARAEKKVKSVDVIKNLEPDMRKGSSLKTESEDNIDNSDGRSEAQSRKDKCTASDCETIEMQEKLEETSKTQKSECFVVTEEWTQSSRASTVALKHKLPIDSDTPSKAVPKTPIQNFSHMNVKEKVQAYEEIVLVTPVPENKRKRSSGRKNTPENSEAVSKEIQKTPDTIVTNKTTSVATAFSPGTTMHYEEIVYEEIPAMPGIGPNGAPSEKKATPRVSQSRKSLRTSMRKSLKMLPSKQKEVNLHAPSEDKQEEKPARTRTRLRLKKKDREVDNESASVKEKSEASIVISSDEKMEEDSDTAQSSNGTQQQEDAKSGSSGDEKQPVTEGTRSTRTKTRQAHQMETSYSSGTNSNEDEADPHRKLRSSNDTVQATRDEEIKDAEMEDCSVVDENPRMTRSKMRKPPVTDDTSEQRTTRTKTRKRQLEEEVEASTVQPKRSRSCYKQDLSEPDKDKTPTKSESSSNDESGDDIMSPVCPKDKVVRPHPKSFLNNLKPLSTTPLRAANINPGLVKSFITRNSPARKPTLKEIQEKRKLELLEKEKKQKELQKKREQEHKRKMEEFRKKREEKMRKVQESREQREKTERENRLNLEKKMAEKRQQTNKLKEEKVKEEKEKQRLRLQKFEEAEVRRRHEEEERRKRLQEQLEHEKAQAEFMQRKREFEEQERHKKMEEEKQRALERQHELEKERERERERLAKIKAAEDEKQKEWLKKKEERDRLIAKEKAEREKFELEKKKERDLQLKKEMEKLKEQEKMRIAEQEKIREQQKKYDMELKKMVDKHNNTIQNQQKQLPKPNLNKTHSLNEPTVNQSKNDSYEMTPDRVHKPSTEENYCIDDIKSDDDTDEEEAPRKKVPDWAQGAQLKALLIKQHLHPPNLDLIFDLIEPPDLNVMFEKKKARFNKRTSSAHWDTPILKPGLFGRI